MNTAVRKVFSVLLGTCSLVCLGLYSEDASATWYTCPQVTGVYRVQDPGGNHIQVQCAVPYQPNILYAGYFISLADNAERFHTMAVAAMLAGKQFMVDMSNTACPGATQNCRTVTSFQVSN